MRGMLLIKAHGDFGSGGGVVMSVCFAVKHQGSGRLPLAVCRRHAGASCGDNQALFR